MPCIEMRDAEDNYMGHICRSNFTYRVQVRRPGHRKWELIKGVHATQGKALAKLCKVFASGEYKRGIVAACPDSPYYDPHTAFEIIKR